MAAPPPALPPRDAGCLGVPAGVMGPVGFGVAPSPVEVVPAVVLTQKYLWPKSDPGNKLPHTVGRVDPWKAILDQNKNRGFLGKAFGYMGSFTTQVVKFECISYRSRACVITLPKTY